MLKVIETVWILCFNLRY